MDRKRGSIIPSIHKAVEDSLRANSVVCGINDHKPTESTKRKRRKNNGDRHADAPLSSAPRHVQKFDWKDMIHLADITGRRRGNSTSSHSEYTTRVNSIKGKSWIETHLKIRQCNHFIPSQRFSERCGCGKEKSRHSDDAIRNSTVKSTHLTLPGIAEVSTDGGDTDAQTSHHNVRWSIKEHTSLLPTDSYGNIIFEGTTHHVQYARLSFDTDPRDIVHLMMKVWKLKPPKLIITVHGGLTKFDLQPKLARSFRKGIMKIAKSTDAWIITSGLDEGVVRHVASALEDHNSQSNNRVVAIGIASWGMLKQRNRFIGKDHTVNYSPNIYNNSRLRELNDRHSYFLFSDNGTINRYGAEIIMRKRLETHLAQGDKRRSSIPLICVVLEGGAFTIKMVHDYVKTIPRIPVVVCDGSGRASDILAFSHQTVSPDGYLSENVKAQLTSVVRRVFGYDAKTAVKIIKQIVECTSNKQLMTIFRLGENQKEDLDHAIMSCLLKGQNLSPAEQLQLALAWNRADIARSEIFANGTEWHTHDLHDAMIEALSNDRIDFVQLLLENGVSMHNFLTFGRLEHLYNTDKGPQNTLRTNLLVDSKHLIRLTEIGRLIENLMGNLYKANYTKDEFKNRYYLFNNRRHFGRRVDNNNGRNEVIGPTGDAGRERMSSMQINLINNARNSIISLFGGNKRKTSDDEECFSNFEEEEENAEFKFRYPYSELLIWAVLTKRQKMAKLMWRYGEEGMAKALVASRLYMSLSQTASLATGEIGLGQDFSNYSEEFSELAVEVLEYCTKHSRDMTLQLLTCELTNWGGETCLSLAANNGHRKFLAHPCCQMLLSDLWQGGLLMKNNQDAKVLSCLLIPPAIFLLGFKTREQLMLQPQTAAEHEYDSDSDVSTVANDDDSSESSVTDTDDSDGTEDEKDRKRTQTAGSEQIMNIQRLMRERLQMNEKKKTESALSRIVVAPAIAPNRNRTKTLSIKKTKKRNHQPYCKDGYDEDEEDEASNYIINTQKRSSIIPANDLYVEHNTNEISNGKLRNKVEEPEGRQETVQILTQRPLSWKRKLIEFYKAPITTYWLWFFAFMVFLVLLTYNILIKTHRNPSWTEWYVFAYILVWSFEILRKVISLIMMDPSKPVIKQIRVYFFSYRNGSLAFALSTYLIAFMIRLSPETRTLGRILIICNSVLWSLKLVDYLSVQPAIGPYITMVAEMIPSMIPICLLVFITMYAFGLLRQGITYPYEEWHWILVRNIFLQPYFMLYGEVYADEIDMCGDEIWDTHEDENIPISQLNVTHEHCVPGYWLAPVGLTVFMLATNVLLMNVMVASCTYIFEANIMSSQQIFLFERYRHVMEYESTPWLPPPFTIVYHIIWVLKWIRYSTRIFERKNLFDASLKLFLNSEEMERVHAFEEESVEDMKRESEKKNQSSNEERIFRTAERTDVILHRVSNLTALETSMKDELRELDKRINMLENRHREEMNILVEMNKKLSKFVSGKRGSESGSRFERIDEDYDIPTIKVEESSSKMGSRKNSGQYIKRDSLNKRNVPSIHIDAAESMEILVPHNTRSRKATESERSDVSEDEVMARDISRSFQASQNIGGLSQRRHSMYSAITDVIDTGNDRYYCNAPTINISRFPSNNDFYVDSDANTHREESDYD